ncbi:MAG: membrane protein YczE [Ilumatobacteraceae bacterium]
MLRTALTDRPAQRLARCVVGLALFGTGISMFVTARLGLAPWDVFHQGVAHHVGLKLGWVIEITGVLLLLLWIPLRQRPGVGTVLNAVEIGLVVNLIGNHLPATDRLVPRLAYVVGAVVVIAIGSGLYIGAGLGTGPRDGIMVAIAARGYSVRVVRTVLEALVLAVGVVLGGHIGIGTVAFMLGIGPLLHVLLPRLTVQPPRILAAAT